MSNAPVSSDQPVTLDQSAAPSNGAKPTPQVEVPLATAFPVKKAPRWRLPLIIVLVIVGVLLLGAGGGFVYLRSTESRLLEQAQAALTAGNWSVVEATCKELNALPANLLVDPNRCVPLRGEAYFQLGRLDEAMADLQATQPQYPNQGQRYLRITQIYLLQNKPDQALTAAAEAQKRDDTLALPYTLQAVDFYRRNQVKDAEQAAQAALKRDPKQAPALRVLGSIQFWRGEYKQAAENLNRAIELDPKDFAALAERAVLNLSMGRHDAFKADSATVIDQTASSPAGLMLQALKAMDEHDPAAALEWINKAIQADGSRPEYYFMRSDMVPTTEKERKNQLADLDKALQLYPDFFMAQGDRDQVLFSLYEPVDMPAEAERLMKAVPESGMGYQMMIMHFSRQNNWTTALEWATKYVDAMPDSTSAYLMRGYLQAAIEENDLALDDFGRVLKLNPDSITARSGAIRVYLAQKKVDEALKLVEEIQTIAPKRPTAYIERAGVLMNQKEFDKARQEINRALEIDPLNVQALTRQTFLNIIAKDYTQATQDIVHIAEVSPKAPDAFILRAEVYKAQDDAQRALDELLKAIEINKYDDYPQQMAGQASFALKEYEKALAFSQEALRLDPKNWDAQQLIAQVYLQQKEYDQAIAAAQKALKLKHDLAGLYLLMADAHVAKGDYAAAAKDLTDGLAYKDQFTLDQVQKSEDSIAFYKTIPPLVDGKRTIRDTKNGYTLSYSTVWDLLPTPSNKSGIVLTLKAHLETPSDKEIALITVITDTVPAEDANYVTVQMYADYLRQTLTKIGFKFSPRQGFKGMEYGLTDDFELKSSDETIHGRLYYFYTPGRFIAIQLTASDDLFDKYKDEVEELAKTLKFVK